MAPGPRQHVGGRRHLGRLQLGAHSSAPSAEARDDLRRALRSLQPVPGEKLPALFGAFVGGVGGASPQIFEGVRVDAGEVPEGFPVRGLLPLLCAGPPLLQQRRPGAGFQALLRREQARIVEVAGEDMNCTPQELFFVLFPQLGTPIRFPGGDIKN